MFFKKFSLIKGEVTKYVGILSALTYSQRPESTRCLPNILSLFSVICRLFYGKVKRITLSVPVLSIKLKVKSA